MSGVPKGRRAGNVRRTLKIKLVLVGETAVGKSSLVLQFSKRQFDENKEVTIGAAFATMLIEHSGHRVQYEIWDTAGQERYRSLAPMYYRGAHAAIIAYDITSQDSFARAKTWIRELQRQASPNIVLALAGNKADLVDKRMVASEEAQAYADDNGILFLETSAKSAMNVNELFMATAKRIPIQALSPGEHDRRPNQSGGNVRVQDEESQSSGGCKC